MARSQQIWKQAIGAPLDAKATLGAEHRIDHRHPPSDKIDIVNARESISLVKGDRGWFCGGRLDPTTGFLVAVIPRTRADSRRAAVAFCTTPMPPGSSRTTITPSNPPKLPLALERK